MFNCFKKYLFIVVFLGTPMVYAMENNEYNKVATDLLKGWMRQSANIANRDDVWANSLKCAIDKPNIDNESLEVIKELCNAGTSLIIKNRTVFHDVLMLPDPKQYLEAVITHARFDDMIK